MGKDVAVVTSAGTYIYNSSGARINSCLNNYRTPQARAAGGPISPPSFPPWSRAYTIQ